MTIACSDWSSPPLNLRLADDEVHLWQASLDQPWAEDLLPILAEDELNRARRFRREIDRQHFIVGRGVLRLILGRYLAIEPDAVQFCYSARGKPAVINALVNDRPLQFNLSHSYGRVLYAITCDRRVGVDLEQVRPLDDVESLIRRFFSAREYAEFCTFPADRQLDAFFQGWICKEAYLKAIGEGLAQLEQVEVSLEPEAPAQLLSIPDCQCTWSVQTLKPAPNYVAALAVEGNDWHLIQWQWTHEWTHG